MLLFKQLRCLSLQTKPTIVTKSPFLFQSKSRLAINPALQNFPLQTTSTLLLFRSCTTSISSQKETENEHNGSKFPSHNPHFLKLDLNGRLIRAMTDLGYTEPTPIQSKTVKLAIRGRDVRLTFNSQHLISLDRRFCNNRNRKNWCLSHSCTSSSPSHKMPRT
jgi:hypothetical protein